MRPEESNMTNKKTRDEEVAHARRYMAMPLTKAAMDRARGHWVPWLIEALDEAEAERDALNNELCAHLAARNGLVADGLIQTGETTACAVRRLTTERDALKAKLANAEERCRVMTVDYSDLGGRARQAEAKLAALVKASQPFANDQGCDAVHHGLADRHDQRDTCPVVARLREALAAAKVQP